MSVFKKAKHEKSKVDQNIELFLEEYREKLKRIEELKATIKLGQRRNAILAKLAEQVESTRKNRVHQLQDTPFDLEVTAAACEQIEKDLLTVSEFVDCVIEACHTKILEINKDVILKEYIVAGKVQNITFRVQFHTNIEVLSGLEREVVTKKIKFTPKDLQLVPLADFLLKNKRLYVLQRALRTFQKLTEELKTTASELSRHDNIEIVMKKSMVVLKCTPPSLVPPESEMSEDSPTVSLTWTVAFSDDFENFHHSFKLVVHTDVKALFQSSEIAEFLTLEEKMKDAADVEKIFTTVAAS